MTPKLWALLVAVAGVISVTVGVAMIYVPAAFLVAGCALVAVGLLVDFEQASR